MKRLVFAFFLLPLASIANGKPYYGEWLIEGHVPTGGISAIAYEEADEYKGTKVVYTSQSANFGKHYCSGAIYQEKIF